MGSSEAVMGIIAFLGGERDPVEQRAGARIPSAHRAAPPARPPGRFGSSLHMQLRGDSPHVIGPLCGAVQASAAPRGGWGGCKGGGGGRCCDGCAECAGPGLHPVIRRWFGMLSRSWRGHQRMQPTNQQLRGPCASTLSCPLSPARRPRSRRRADAQRVPCGARARPGGGAGGHAPALRARLHGCASEGRSRCAARGLAGCVAAGRSSSTCMVLRSAGVCENRAPPL